jgi:uncharacterized protein YukE
MATDAALLLRGLQEYRGSLDLHLDRLKAEFNHLDARWHAFSGEYEGEAAAQFRAHWLRTRLAFEEYISATERISKLLDERIDALIRAENASTLWG